MMMLSGCAVEPEIRTVKIPDCSMVPYVELTDEQIDALRLDQLFDNVITRIRQQTQIIDLCKVEK